MTNARKAAIAIIVVVAGAAAWYYMQRPAPIIPIAKPWETREAEVFELTICGQNALAQQQLRIPKNKPVHVKGRVRVPGDIGIRKFFLHGETPKTRIQFLSGVFPVQPDGPDTWKFEATIEGPKHAMPMDLYLQTFDRKNLAAYSAIAVEQ